MAEDDRCHTREDATAKATETIDEGLRRRGQIDDQIDELETTARSTSWAARAPSAAPRSTRTGPHRRRTASPSARRATPSLRSSADAQ